MNNRIRTGKIARLPKPIREEINQRLEKGASAKSLVGWLNGLPEVQALVQAECDGHPISEHNLSQWKNGGYEDWLRYQEALALAEHLYEQGEELKAKGKERMPMSEVLNLWLTSRYIVSTKQIEVMEGEEAWRKQRQMCDDLMKMRRAEHREAHLQLERERVELQREEVQLDRERLKMERAEKKRRGGRVEARSGSKDESVAGTEPQPDQRWEDISDEEKIAWARRPENMERINPPLTDEEHVARMKEIFGISAPIKVGS